MISWLVHNLQTYPEIAIFLTLALGFLIGGVKIGSFSLGNVTGVLLAGVLIGQLQITISPHVKAVFFLMFLFAVGYGVGPQFFHGLRGDGLPQVLFSIVICVACLLASYIAAKLAGYNVGQAAGLLSGACTISAVLGVATDSINQLPIGASEKKVLIDSMPVAYAVTYLYGTAGSAWFLATIGPKLLGVDLEKECKEYEAKMGATAAAAGQIAYTEILARAYQLTNPQMVGKTVRDFEAQFPGERVFVQRIRQGGRIVECDQDTVIEQNAVLALTGKRHVILQNEDKIGREVNDREVLNIEVEILDAVVTNKELDGKTIQEIATMEENRQGRGVFLRKLVRAGQEMPFNPGLKVQRGDTLTIVGSKKDISRAASFLGYADRATEKTDVVFMGLGIAVGALVGAITIKFGSVPIGLSTSGGALIAGLVCGWLRSVNRTFGRIPAPALWAFNNMGLTIFIAVVGLSTGPSFVDGLKQAGLSLFLWGVFVTTMPFVIGLLAGKYIFKMHPGILLGACAGARTTTAALGAIQDVARSNVPALGYTVTYAVGNTLLIIWGVIIVFMMT